jgi:hypothetical protein
MAYMALFLSDNCALCTLVEARGRIETIRLLSKRE